ncbi:MAG: large extracellular alpha-helical protein, partial [Alphaproteobacteria bacterium]|nr:large extracellular alpha-helical protein [Alphaproteobacteria bacterium]
ANSGDAFAVYQAHTKGKVYSVFLPERLKAEHPYTIASKAPALTWWERFLGIFRDTRTSDMRDAFGRLLAKPFSLSFTTDSRPPNYVLASTRYVLESGVDSDVPLYVTNLEKATLQFSKLAQGSGITSSSHDVPFTQEVKNIQFAVPLGIRGILGDKSGLVSGSLSTSPIVNKDPAPVFAQVTPFAVHAKLGHFNTLVWVTDMKTGLPVEGAKVSIYKAKERLLTTDYTALDRANTNKDGTVLLKGNEALDPDLNSAWCYGEGCENLIVRVESDQGMAYLPLLDDYQVNSWRVSNNQIWENIQRRYGHIHAWGTTAQGVYRVGDTMQYKLFLRNQDTERYTPPPAGKYTLEITDPLGNSVFKKEGIALSEFGAYAGEFAIPATAPLGWYDFTLSGDFTEYTWQPMRVLVTDFTPSPFKVRNSLNGDLFRAGDSIEVDTQATLHSGGAYTDADLRVTASLNPRSFTSKDKLAEGFFFDTYSTDSSDLFSVNARIDDKGANLTKEKLPETSIIYGRLSVESAVRDDRGKYIAHQAEADYIGVDRLVGIKSDAWMFNVGKPASVKTLVVDEKGKPAAGTKVNLLVERQETKASRVKGAGNAYLTQYVEEWVKAAECNLTSAAAQAQDCAFTPDKPGSYRATASISDTDGKTHSTNTFLWVTGQGDVVWQSKDDSALDIVAEKNTYAIGDTANFLVKNPYPGAQALITIERYGVLKQWVQTLEGSTPTISFPVERDFMPGFYLSVVIVSPRVEAAPPTFGQVDLGKPTFRIGYTRIDVQDTYKLIDVTAKTDAEVYKPGSEVQLTLHAEPRHKDTQEPIEIAVAVLDEAVLDLVPNGRNYYDPYKGFFTLDGLDLTNYNLLRQLVGRQYFEKKGANPGGDGGADLAMRTNFKFVSYWNPSVKVDADGNATASFTLPDNLTGWRVLAFAVTPTDRMGLGDVSFKVNQPTEIRPVMPNQVTEGDTFRAGFSVMNRTDAKRTLKVTLAAKGALKNGDQLQESTITLAPYKRETVYLNVETATLPAERENAQGEVV